MIQLRRNGTKFASAAISFYLARSYIRERLEDLKERVEQERVARANLKSRFHKTQEEISFLVLALISTLADRVLDELNIETLIQELHTMKRRVESSQPPSSLSSSVEIVEITDSRSDVDSIAHSTSISAPSLQSDSGAEDMVTSSVLSESISSLATSNTESSLLEQDTRTSSSTGTSPHRTKVELWNQVKIMTFTRTLAVLYSTTLLSLLTTVQLTVLARYKYMRSVQQMAYDEQINEVLDSELSLSNLFFGTARLGNLGVSQDDGFQVSVNVINDEAERKYLSLSWWILHVGWKDIGERVRRGVEEVLNDISLKSKLAAVDLYRLIHDIRRRVDHEVTFEGTERRVDFLSSLLPPTAEMTQHVLIQGGYGQPVDTLVSSLGQRPYLPPGQDPQFTLLHDETRSILSSSDFSCVLEICLDRATEILFSDLDETVFAKSNFNCGEEARIQLAGLLPGLANWSDSTLKGTPNEMVDNILGMREVAALSAIVFSKFEEYMPQ